MNVRVMSLCALVAWCSYVHNADTLHSGGCYKNLFHLFCEYGNKIALDNIYAIAMSANCSPVAPVEDTPARICCEQKSVVHNCKMNYTGFSVSTYHEHCSGNDACSKEIERQPMYCADDAKTVTNYMAFEYHCVNDSSIVRIPSNEKASEMTVSIQNKEYPTSGLPDSSGMCNVTASNNSSIAVSLLHLNITCQQNIGILGGSTPGNISCENNTNFSSGTLYTSQNPFISLNWTSELTGRLSIQFTATNRHAILELQCEATESTNVSTFRETMITKSHTTLPNVTVYTDATTTFTNNLLTTPAVPPVLSTSTPQHSASIQPISGMMTTTKPKPQTSVSIQPISTTMTTTTPNPQTSVSIQPISITMTTTSITQTSAPFTSARGGMTPAKAASIGTSVVVCVIILLTLIYFLHKKKHQRTKVGSHSDDALDAEFADALGITRPKMGSKAPAAFVIPPRPRRLSPIEVPRPDIHH